jgi:hypothetical protein
VRGRKATAERLKAARDATAALILDGRDGPGATMEQGAAQRRGEVIGDLTAPGLAQAALPARTPAAPTARPWRDHAVLGALTRSIGRDS